MGMDVYGRAPMSEEGRYFRANIWSWPPILDMMEKTGVLPPWMIEGMRWNDGAGPNDNQAEILADELEKMVEGMEDGNMFVLDSPIDGAIASVIQMFEEQGATVQSEVVYATEVSHMREFITFCRESGGFEVW